MKVSSLKLGHIYEIKWYDHYSNDGESPEQAARHEPMVLTSYGIFVARNPKYVILAWIYDNETSTQNDNMHILKNQIKSIRELK